MINPVKPKLCPAPPPGNGNVRRVRRHLAHVEAHLVERSGPTVSRWQRRHGCNANRSNRTPSSEFS